MNTPSVRPPPIRGRALSTVLLAWLLLATGCGSHTDLAEHVALRLTTQEIEPGSRFEVVFDDPVVRLDHLGSPAENPLQIDPPLAGTFAWRSRRSGIFNPSEPMHLGTRYQFTLRPGLRDATGQPLRARLRRSFQTPGLTATLRHDGWWDESDAPALPGVIVTLNARVDAKDFQDLALFTDDHTGMGVTAEPLSWQPDASSPGMETRFPTWQDVPTWEERFPGASNLPPHAPGPPGRASAFLIRPQAPLASTNVWRLEIWALGSEETRLSLGTVSNIIGRAVPFIVQSAEAANTVHGGRQLRLHFSRRVAPGLATNDPASWLVCEPAVTNLTVERSAGGRTLAVSGAFRLGQDYRISVNRNLPGEEPVTLTRPFNQQFRFEPIRPSVWLAEFNTVQLATGRRQMEMLAVNTPETRLRIKALDRHGLIPTLRAYERYLRSGSPYTPDTVPGAALDYAGIPGRTVYDNHLASAGPRDETVPLVRSWDDLGALGIHGAFFLEADLHQVPVEAGGTGTRVGPQAIVQLTDLGLVTKTGALDTTVWVFSHTSAKPLAGVTVNLRSEEDEILAEAVTDNDGLVHLPASERAKWVLAERAGDLHAERLGDGEIPMWGFQLPGTGRESADLRLFAFSDREAYRPGETLHLKILARTWSEIGWQFPTNPSVKLQLSGPRGDVTLRTNLILSASGSTEWMWTAPVGVRGTFQARLECGDAQANHAFEVRDFQPAAFEVTLGAKPVYGPDDVLTIPVQARYLFGQPLAHAKVLWSADASDQTFAPEGWKTFRFGLALGDWRLIEAQAPAGEAARHGTGELNAGAPLMLAPELPFNPVFPQPQAVRFLAEVTDLNQQTLAQSAEFVRHPSDFYLGFRWTRGEEALLVTNVPLAFQLVAVRTDGTPWPAPVEVQAKLRRVEWKAVRILRAGRVIGHRSEPEYHDVVERTVRTQTAARIGERWQAADDSGRSLPSWEAGPWGSMAGRKTRPPRAIATAPGGRVFLPVLPRWQAAADDSANADELPALSEPGAYVLELRTQDGTGHPVLTTVGFGVSGDGHLAWHQQNGAQLDLVPDRSTHLPGETATLLVKAPFPGTALVTVERGDVRRSFTTELHGNAPAISFPLQTNDSPNVFVSVTLVRGLTGNPHAHPMPEWRLGYQLLDVPAPQDHLEVRVMPEAPVRMPGETVNVRASVRDSAGEPVPGAEVTLYAVDEGYLLLKGTPVPDPTAPFTEPRPLGVKTALSLPNLLPEDPELRRFENKGHLAGGGGRFAHQRHSFIPCPYWNVALLTDPHGGVAVSFVAPDSLTRYRIVAVATHGPRAMGSGAGVIEVRKNLMIEPALPRFAHVGDRLLARALVFNKGERELSALATLQPGTNAVFAPDISGHVRVTVAPGGIAVVEFPVVFKAPGADLWQWRVEADGLSDAVTAPLPVTYAEAGLRDVRHLRVAAGVTNLLAEADPALFELPESVSVRLATTPLAFLGESVGQLLHYPYGCVEQTGSSLLPWIALRDFPGLLPADRRDPTNFTAALNGGVQRFWSMQTADGGLAYWPGGSSSQRWGSAYAAWILALARDAGADVSTNRLARLHHWLNDQWHADAPELSPEALNERCLTAFALAAAGVSEPALQEALLLDRDRLTGEDRALLAVALLKSGGDRNKIPGLLQPTRGKKETTGRFGNGARIAALRLLAFSRLDAEAPEIPGLVGELIGAAHSGHWGTTQGNAWALWALTELARRPDAPMETRGEIGGAGDVHGFTLDRGHPIATFDSPITPGDIPKGMMLSHSSAAPLYVEVTLAGRRPTGTNAVSAIDRGFSLSRTYARLDEQNQPHPAEGLRVGDRVLVTLEIEAPESGEWIAIEDPLPAVLEPVQGVFKTETTGATALLDAWTSDFQEVRSDRMLIFRDDLPEGRHVIRYLARVRAAGDTVAAPAKIEAMYEPQRHGFSTGTRLQSKATD